jgi:hypothetical protein
MYSETHCLQLHHGSHVKEQRPHTFSFFREMNKVTQRLLMLKKQNNTMTAGERKRDYCSTTLDPGKF